METVRLFLSGSEFGALVKGQTIFKQVRGKLIEITLQDVTHANMRDYVEEAVDAAVKLARS